MHAVLQSVALCGALFISIASAAANREPTPQELAELQQLIDGGHFEEAGDMTATFSIKGIWSTAVDAQVMRLQYFKKEYDAAFEIAERVLVADSRHTGALNIRGLVKVERGDAAGALADFDAAITIDPAFGKAHFNRAMLLCGQKRFDEADKAYRTAVERVPEKAGVWQAQFSCHFRAGRLEQAVDVAGEWWTALPGYEALARLSEAERAAGDYDKAYKDYLAAYAMHGGNNDMRSFTARVMLNIGAPELALKSLNEQIAETPGNQLLYLERGEALDMLGRDDEALVDYDRGLARVDQSPPPMRARPIALRGLIMLERGNVTAATANFDLAIITDSDDPVGWYGRGEIWMRTGHHDAAISAYRKALEILPDDKTYRTALEKAQAAKKP